MAINKVEANGQTLIDLTNDTATATDVIEGKTLHLASGAVATGTYRPSDEIEARLEATVGHACKNLYQITVDTQTINGVTFNVDKANGTITVNGTSPSNKEATLKQSFIVTKNLAGKKYFSVPLNQTGSSTTFDAYIYDNTAHKFVTKWDGSTRSPYIYGTESQEVLLIEGHTVEYTCRIFKGQTVSNLIYKPMIRDGSISDDTFEPYIEPTDSQIETKTRAYLNSSLGHVTKNLFNLSGHNAIPSGLTISTEDVATGRLVASATGAWKGIGWSKETLNLDPNKRYTITLTNNLANSIGRLCNRDLTNNISTTIINLNTTGDKEYSFIPAVDFASNYRLEVFCTFSSNSSATGSIDISNFMIREASISDDTFEPYVTPTDEKKQDKPVELDPTVLTWNIADLQSKYTHIQIICECISTSSTPNMDIYDVITIPTIIFGRTANSEKYIAFASGTSFSGVDGVYFTEANGNVTADITSSTGHGTRNIIQIIGIPK